ncbi:MAG: hypothetical protein H7138_17680 [Myxococcales bacterium]|nr:hypothetical protein [Myxococcales bacterium]
MKRAGYFMLLTVAGCGTGDAPPRHELRAAVDRAQYSLGDAVGFAETSMERSTSLSARIDKDVDQFAVGAIAADQRRDVRLDFAGHVVSARAAGPVLGGCRAQITLAESLAIAEATVKGAAVAAVADDDDPCLREIQVLVDTTLWEVKIGPDGAVVETELSDEDL